MLLMRSLEFSSRQMSAKEQEPASKKRKSGDALYTVEEELKLAEAAANAFDKQQEQKKKASDDDKKGDDKKKSDPTIVGLFTDIEGRNADLFASPPSAIASIAGVMEPGRYQVLDVFYSKCRMPLDSRWEPACASWTLNTEGGGGPAMITRDAKDAVPPFESFVGLNGFAKIWQTNFEKCFWVGDAISYDFSALSVWNHKLTGGLPLHYKQVGERQFQSPLHLSQMVAKARKSLKWSAYDYENQEAVYAAMKLLGFAHTHHPVDDAESMYAHCYIAAFYEPSKYLEVKVNADGKKETTVVREYNIEVLKRHGVVPSAHSKIKLPSLPPPSSTIAQK